MRGRRDADAGVGGRGGECSVYYPEEVDEVKEVEGWGSVRCMSLREISRTEVRELRVLKEKGKSEGGETGEERVVWHFLFLGWPDHDIPVSPQEQAALVELIKLSRCRLQAVKKEDGEKDTPPRLVHCSAGVGRTGTFIALDHLLQELDEGSFDDFVDEDGGYDSNDNDSTTYPRSQDVDPVFETVKKLREQRMFMVGKPGQYAFIYQILKESWQKRGNGGQSPRIGEASQTKKRRLVQDGSDDEELDMNSQRSRDFK